MLGPPGAEEPMIAIRIPTTMPWPSLEEFLEVLNIHSAAGRTLSDGRPLSPPFRLNGLPAAVERLTPRLWSATRCLRSSGKPIYRRPGEDSLVMQ
jgi:predicted ATPase with chaperone activity